MTRRPVPFYVPTVADTAAHIVGSVAIVGAIGLVVYIVHNAEPREPSPAAAQDGGTVYYNPYNGTLSPISTNPASVPFGG